MASLVRHLHKGEAMAIRFLFVFLYLSYVLSFGPIVPKTGGGTDPNGATTSGPMTLKTGGGLSPDGLTSAPPPGETGGGLSPDGRP
jgi:hypothetical protein